MKGLLKRNKKTFIFMTSLLLFLIGAGVIQEIVKNLKPFEDVPVVSVETKDENKNQGSEILKKPVNDLSRGCTVDDIFNTVVITAIQAQQG